jgi:tRNA nucleotidyltransferase/poly(A) polymerase
MSTQVDKPRRFAEEVVRQLREAGFEAYWAGGCVRDQLLGREPKDYDVATNATPSQIQQVFRRRRTLALGAAFGVITVLGPRGAGQIEVTTFRRDATYSDGRHPDSVVFTSAREDALRRDFTINGLFSNPATKEVLDFVGGRQDIALRRVRAIGDPAARFGEDKLRMLRAVRFSATLEFALEKETFEAIRRMAQEITVVSPERILSEMERILIDSHRSAGVRMLLETGLAKAVLPEVEPLNDDQREQLKRALSVIEQLDRPGFPLVLAALLHRRVESREARRLARRWRMSNRQTDRVSWLLENRDAVDHARQGRWSTLQPILVAPGIEDLLAWVEARRRVSGSSPDDVAWCRAMLGRPREELDPPALVTGNDLIRHGVAQGPSYRGLLARVRNAQLDGEIATTADALALVDRLLAGRQAPAEE